MTPFGERVERLRQALNAEGFDGLVTDAPADIFYFTGCSDVGGYLSVSCDGSAWLLTSAHDFPQAEAVASGVEVAQWRPGGDAVALVEERLRQAGMDRVVVPSLSTPVFAALADVGLELAPGFTARLRRVKEEAELELIRRAARIVEAGMAAAWEALRPGVREVEVAAAASDAMRRLGRDGWVFRPKVESGWRSAWPSTYASDKVVAAGELVLIDLGPTYRGYYGDLTRTFVLGEPTSEQRRLLDAVLKAQAAALAAVRPGATGHEVDAAARDVLTEAGYGAHFLHHTGHTLGLVGDAWPMVAPNEETALVEGECVTIEPGAYVPEVGGVRIEDEVLVTADGCEVLTRFGKEIDNLVLAT